ncbi:signal transduction histidine kinase [Beggiatoa sp. PS]|nr:signal transduction histidine kinase [Beggiatoa sp. PS]
MPELIQELRAHKIELERQNEELRNTQYALEKANEKYTGLYDSAPVGYFTFDIHGTILEVNLTGANQLGIDIKFLYDKPFVVYLDYDSDETFSAHLKNVIQLKSKQTCELKINPRKGKRFYAQVVSTGVLDETGIITEIRSVIIDINDKKQTEQTFKQQTIALTQTNQRLQQEILSHQKTETRLRENSQTLRATFDATLETILLLELDGTIVNINPTGATRFRKTSKEMIGLCLFDLLPPIIANKRIQAVEKVVRTKRPVTIDRERLSINRWFECYFYPVFNEKNKVVRIVLFGRDITQQKQIEDELRAQQKFLRLVIDNVPQFIFWKNINSVYLGCNQHFAKMTGLDIPEKIVGKTDFDLPWKPEETEKFRADDKRVMENKIPEYHLIERAVTTNGQQIWADTSKVPLSNEKGKVIGILGSFEDITERKKAELELLQSQAALEKAYKELNHLKTTLDITLDAIFMHGTEDNKFFYVNQGAINSLGYTQEELLQMTPLDILPEYDEKQISKLLAPLFNGSQQKLVFQTVHQRKNGTLFPVEIFLQCISIAGQQNHFIAVARDITERNKVEAELKEAEIGF